MSRKPEMQIVLLDQDGVLADFEGKFLEVWRERHIDLHPGIPIDERSGFLVRNQYPTECLPQIIAIQTERGFFRDLPPVLGAIEGARALVEKGYDVRICTSPLSGNAFCPSEKFEWVEQHLGAEWVDRVILTKDKTLVHGTILVDDKVNITGVNPAPTWKHVLYDAPHNRGIQGIQRVTWGTLETTIIPILERLQAIETKTVFTDS